MQNSIFQNIYSLYPFDKNTYTLGRLCLRNHDYYNTGYTLRTKLNQICSFCNNIKSAEWSKTEKEKNLVKNIDNPNQVNYLIKNINNQSLEKYPRKNLEIV
jgi:hypothetical protein